MRIGDEAIDDIIFNGFIVLAGQYAKCLMKMARSLISISIIM